jgi:hypothetical protein
VFPDGAQRGEAGERVEGPALDRPHRDAALDRDLRLAETAPVGELPAVQEAAVAGLGATTDPAVTEVVAFAAYLVSFVGGSRPESGINRS